MMGEELSIGLPMTSRFTCEKHSPDYTYHQAKGEKQPTSNVQNASINYNPFNSPQQKTKTNLPFDFFNIQHKINVTEMPQGNEIPVFHLNEAQAQDPIKFIESVFGLGQKYGAVKVILPEQKKHVVGDQFQLNSDLFWFQTNKLLNNPPQNELECRLKFHKELLKFHLDNFKKITSETAPEASSKEASAKAAPANEAPSNEALANEAPVNEAPSNELPVNEAPVNEASTQNITQESYTPTVPSFTAPEVVQNDSTPGKESPGPTPEPKKSKGGSPAFFSKLPMIDKRPLDLYRLFKSVLMRGGFIEVINKKLWAQIGRELGYKGKIMTSLSSSLKSLYLKILYPFEVYLMSANHNLNEFGVHQVDSNDAMNQNDKRPIDDTPGSDYKRLKKEAKAPLIIGSSKQVRRSIKSKANKGFLLNLPHLIETKPPSIIGHKAQTEENKAQDNGVKQESEDTKGKLEENTEAHKKRRRNNADNLRHKITPYAQINHALKAMLTDSSVQDETALSLNGRFASVYTLRQFMEKDLKFQEFLIQHNKDYFRSICMNPVNDSYQYSEESFSHLTEKCSIASDKLEDLYWKIVSNELDTTTIPKIVFGDGIEIENGTSLPSFINGSGFTRIENDFVNFKNYLQDSNAIQTNSSTSLSTELPNLNSFSTPNTASMSGDPKYINHPDNAKNSVQSSLNPWNLHNLPVVPNSLLGSLLEYDVNNRDIIEPSINIGMTFSTDNWRCEDHFTQLCNYQFFGASKRWYFIPESEFDNFEALIKEVNTADRKRVNLNNDKWDLEKALEELTFDSEVSGLAYEILINSLENMINIYADNDKSRLQYCNNLFQAIIDYKRKEKDSILFNQDYMISPKLLQERGIQFFTTTQKPGELVLKYPKTYTSTISFGFNFSEEVNFASKSWLDYAIEGEKWILKQGILPNFSIFKLVLNVIQLHDSGNTNIVFDSDIYKRIAHLYEDFYKKELELRNTIRKSPLTIRELVLDEKYFNDIDVIADDNLSYAFPSKVVLTDLKTKQTFSMSLESFLSYAQANMAETVESENRPRLLKDSNIKIELHLFYSDEKLKQFKKTLASYSLNYDEWMENYQKFVSESTELSLRQCKSLLSDGEKIYSLISSSNLYSKFNAEGDQSYEDYSSIKLNTFKTYMESLRSFVYDANDYIEECQAVLSIKHQQRMRNNNSSSSDSFKQCQNVLERLVKLVDRISTLNFSCPEIEQIIEFKNEIENFDRACRSAILKAPNSNAERELNELINLGNSFGVDLPSLHFVTRLRDKLKWEKRYTIIVSGEDPFNDSKRVFTLEDLHGFRSEGIQILGKEDTEKLRMIDAIIDNSEDFNNMLLTSLSLKIECLDHLTREKVDSLFNSVDEKIREKSTKRIFLRTSSLDYLINLRSNFTVVETFKEFLSVTSSDGAFPFLEALQLQKDIIRTNLMLDTTYLNECVSKAENWLSSLSILFKSIKLRHIFYKIPVDEDFEKLTAINDNEIIKKLKFTLLKVKINLSLSTDNHKSMSEKILQMNNEPSNGDVPLIYCICRENEFGTMIECDTCKEWYHLECISDVSPNKAVDEDHFLCPLCHLVQSDTFTDEFLKQKTSIEDLTNVLQASKRLKVLPRDEAQILSWIFEASTGLVSVMETESQKLISEESTQESKIEELYHYLRKIYGAPLSHDGYLKDLLCTVRQYEMQHKALPKPSASENSNKLSEGPPMNDNHGQNGISTPGESSLDPKKESPSNIEPALSNDKPIADQVIKGEDVPILNSQPSADFPKQDASAYTVISQSTFDKVN
ncbi:Piso0_002083 [Millerozyma farinosa CBS 7064]|uniref:Piso0_002083 protein n=1 Tax=Pichia sorbitophila (strain ATCC MYA-4447 / BCRC 22081 / CBS 7064 / NBRC 10061 / NRRL Y-12695) TaxID=559304 RepID=G8YBM9_PICSO|nr:Piso0_002083 [Millerozyma farinosa CBS 7064]